VLREAPRHEVHPAGAALRYSRELPSTFLTQSGIAPCLAAAALAIGAAGLGVWLGGARDRARLVVPFSAGVLLGVALFGLFPEMAGELGWTASMLLFASGYGILFAVNRYVYPVCPSCSHDHDHNACATVLHGFAAPLLVATAAHAFLDGWSMASVQGVAPLGIRLTVPLAVGLHKIPEGVAVGAILWASTRSRAAALVWSAVAESCTVAGGAVGLALAPRLGSTWILYPLAVAGGCFFFLGFHAIHEEWKRRGPVPAFMPALTGVAGAAALQQGVQALFR
jgi:zinc transporter ZupT